MLNRKVRSSAGRLGSRGEIVNVSGWFGWAGPAAPKVNSTSPGRCWAASSLRPCACSSSRKVSKRRGGSGCSATREGPGGCGSRSARRSSLGRSAGHRLPAAAMLHGWPAGALWILVQPSPSTPNPKFVPGSGTDVVWGTEEDPAVGPKTCEQEPGATRIELTVLGTSSWRAAGRALTPSLRPRRPRPPAAAAGPRSLAAPLPRGACG